MKISVVRNILMKQSIIIVAVFIVLSSISWYIGSLSDENDEKIRYLENQVNSVTRQAMDLSAEYGKVTSVMDEYLVVKKKQDSKMLEVDKMALRDVLAEARKKYNVDILEVKVGEIKNLSGDKYKRDTIFIESSDINLKLNSLIDLDVFSLIQTLENAFSGVKITYLKLSLAKEPDATSLSTIKSAGFVPMVAGELKFTLFGLRNIVADTDLLTDGADKLSHGSIPQNLIQNRMR